jgi:hypothetical protein
MSAGLYLHADGRLAIIAPAAPPGAGQGDLFAEAYLAFNVEPYMRLRLLLNAAADRGAGPMRDEDSIPWKTSWSLWSLRGWSLIEPEAVMHPEVTCPGDDELDEVEEEAG